MLLRMLFVWLLVMEPGRGCVPLLARSSSPTHPSTANITSTVGDRAQALVTATTTPSSTESDSTATEKAAPETTAGLVFGEDLDNRPLLVAPTLKNFSGCGVPREVGGFRREGRFTPTKEDERIVGGILAARNEFPWQCALLNRNNEYYGCSATLLSCDPPVLVTAAHCLAHYPTFVLDKLNGLLKISCGDYTVGNPTDPFEQRLPVMRAKIHPKFSRVTQQHDIALLMVSAPFECNKERIWPACVPSEQKLDYLGVNDTWASGWGTTFEGGPTAPVLRKVSVPIVSDELCKRSYPLLAEKQICAGVPEGGKDSCQGDSGGPLVVRHEGEEGYSLAGVVSFGEGCARPNLYGVYTEVSHYIDWINENITF